MKYEKPELEWSLFDEADIVTLSVGENEGGKFEGLPGL